MYTITQKSELYFQVFLKRQPTIKNPLRIVPLSDLHVDSIHSNHERLQEHLNWIAEHNAYVILCGDTLDAMQGKFDPRQHLNDLRPEILQIMQQNQSEYYSAVVSYAAEQLSRLRSRVWLMLMGNHETAIAQKHGFDVLTPLASSLTTTLAGYRAFIDVVIPTGDGLQQSLLIYATHGERTVTDAPVTLGVISTNRRNASIHADVYISGHTHNTWSVFTPRLGPYGISNAIHIQCPSYKETIKSSGFEAERGQVKPRAILYCLKVFVSGTDINVSLEIPSI